MRELTGRCQYWIKAWALEAEVQGSQPAGGVTVASSGGWVCVCVRGVSREKNVSSNLC